MRYLLLIILLCSCHTTYECRVIGIEGREVETDKHIIYYDTAGLKIGDTVEYRLPYKIRRKPFSYIGDYPLDGVE